MRRRLTAVIAIAAAIRPYYGRVRDYDAVHRAILEMADMLSDGIVAQFPQRFR